ncbi:sporulation-specific protein 22 [Microbotryomycetes sp. JL221]|nr:sporulation-specific protein 22 [Microbotryomycetes sp. JL221]
MSDPKCPNSQQQLHDLQCSINHLESPCIGDVNRATAALCDDLEKWRPNSVELPADQKLMCDDIGTRLWNVVSNSSFTAASSSGANTPRSKLDVDGLVARARIIALNFKDFGALDSPSSTAHEEQLELSNELYLSIASIAPLQQLDQILTVAAKHAAVVEASFAESRSPCPGMQACMLASYYTCRVTFALDSQKIDLATWAFDKLLPYKPLLNKPKLIECAGLLYNAACKALTSKLRPGLSASALALPSLAWSLELISNVAVLKASAHAHLQTEPPQVAQALQLIDQALAVEPCSVLARRSLSLSFAAGASAQDILERFAGAANIELNESLVHQVYDIPPQRRSICFQVLAMLAQKAAANLQTSDSTERDPLLLSQIVKSAVLLATANDIVLLKQIFAVSTIDQESACLLTEADAFLCVVHFWRLSDTAAATGDCRNASEWLLLATHPVFASIDTSVGGKSLRKAALLLLSKELPEEAAAVVARLSNAQDSDEDKIAVLRFSIALKQDDEAQATKALSDIACATSHESSLQLLLWAASTALEKGASRFAVIASEHVISLENSNGSLEKSAQVLVVLRSLIRLWVTKAEKEEASSTLYAEQVTRNLEAARLVCAKMANTPAVNNAAAFSNEVAWLYRTGHNFCVKARKSCSPGNVMRLFEVIADLIDVDQQLESSDRTELAQMSIRCRLAAVAISMKEIERPDNDNEKLDHVERITKLLNLIQHSLQFEDASNQPLVEAWLAFKFDLVCREGDWQSLRITLEDRSILQAVTLTTFEILIQHVLNSDTIDLDCALYVIEVCFKTLFSRRGLDTSKLASWLRLMVHCLLDRQPHQALSYAQSAVRFIEASATYPREEAEWLAASCWNKGLDQFDQSLLELGNEWCSVAIEICQFAKLPASPQLQSDLARLMERCVSSHENDNKV